MRCVHKIPILVTSTHPCTMHCASTDVALNLGCFICVWAMLCAVDAAHKGKGHSGQLGKELPRARFLSEGRPPAGVLLLRTCFTTAAVSSLQAEVAAASWPPGDGAQFPVPLLSLSPAAVASPGGCQQSLLVLAQGTPGGLVTCGMRSS